jgi:HD-GYP domain-containing protein (c-di-GMP phosphodiesterase class II)
MFHHERWDGEGYPYGIGGEEIPLTARIFCVGDALDSMTTDKPYRKRLSLAVAREEIRMNAGKQFDPIVVQAFLEVPESEWERLQGSGNRDLPLDTAA